MERNRPVTVLALSAVALICIVGVCFTFAAAPEHPIRSSLLALTVILGGLLAITGIHFLMFVPLFSIITKLWGKNRRPGGAEHGAGG
jgi:hypothetical protein